MITFFYHPISILFVPTLHWKMKRNDFCYTFTEEITKIPYFVPSQCPLNQTLLFMHCTLLSIGDIVQRIQKFHD